ncbi:hypothetical protein KY284_024186 [Solanum tuberosum]|nr:hypothetical protein KY284_024186 [Solanum tuberosum]
MAQEPSLYFYPPAFTSLIRGRDCRASTPEAEKVVDESFTPPCTDEALVPTISYLALFGGLHPTTLRFSGNVKGSPVKVLLDGANTHNFMHPCVANFLKLPIESSSQFLVLVGSGHTLRCLGVVHQVSLTIQGFTLCTDFLIIEFHESDMVLGIVWLRSLGRTVSDYASLLFEFSFAGKTIKWVGDPAPSMDQVQFSSLCRLTTTDSVACFYRLDLITPNSLPLPELLPDLTSLLSSFSDIFNKPTALPPSRPQDHRIPLLPNSNSVNVHPYRYPNFQKSDIESDYRALNLITVKDRLPIPTIDELFDELHRACFFSKLDLLAGYHQIRVHPPDIEKTTFRTHEGHYEGLQVDPDKIHAIVSWPTPLTVKDVWAFLGLTGYYRRFVKSYAHIASALTDLLKKDVFRWTDLEVSAFVKLKEALNTVLVLRLPDFYKIFTVETDASGDGIGAILSQEGHPIAFFSQKHSSRMRVTSTYHREMFAITEAVQKWRQYLLGRKFLILTDEEPLKSLTTQIILGKLNTAANVLSRVLALYSLTMAVTEFDLVSKLRELNKHDASLVALRQQLQDDPASLLDYSFHGGLLLFRNRLVISTDLTLRKLLLQELHASTTGGHAGIARTFHRLSSNFYWQGIRSNVNDFVSHCQVCQQMKDTQLNPTGLLQPLPIPDAIFEEISMDFITCLPPSHGCTTILVIVDRLSKYGHFIALPPSFTSQKVAVIVTDRDPLFLSDFWKEINRLQGTHLGQTNGQTEALNKCLEMYLRCFTTDAPTDWFKLLPWAELWYNTAYQSSSQMTSFEVVYGRPPPTISRYVMDGSHNPAVTAAFRKRDETLSQLRTNLLRSQERMKSFADKGRREVAFNVGDWVYALLQPYRQLSVRLQKQNKLSRRYFGPFQVLKRIGEVAYKLDLPASSRIHPTFHVSVLRKCIGTPDQQVTPLELLDQSSALVLMPESTLQQRVLHKGNGQLVQWLIKWSGLPDSDATWEAKSTIL